MDKNKLLFSARAVTMFFLLANAILHYKYSSTRKDTFNLYITRVIWNLCIHPYIFRYILEIFLSYFAQYHEHQFDVSKLIFDLSIFNRKNERKKEEYYYLIIGFKIIFLARKQDYSKLLLAIIYLYKSPSYFETFDEKRNSFPSFIQTFTSQITLVAYGC